jgi:hypothetical protein
LEKKITIRDIKDALKDSRFRLGLPKEMESEVEEFLNNPGCPCHMPLYRKIIKSCKEHLSMYFPGRIISDLAEEESKLAENRWMVINCHVDELESRLARLGPGRKQIDVARWNDQVTAVINELDFF